MLTDMENRYNKSFATGRTISRFGSSRSASTKTYARMWKVFLLIAFIFVAGNAKDCVPRSFGENNIVCVCNSTYCDNTPISHPKIPKNGTFYWYVSTKEGDRLKLTKGQLDSNKKRTSADETVVIDTTKKYQQILGFGGAFTDSAGINIKSLSQATQDQLLQTYFDQKTGSRYAFGRVPIGGSDFSTRPYTYDDVEGDTTLANFSLASEDYNYKIPLMQKALKLNNQLKFFAATWSPPPWMKTNDKINGFGFLKKEYYQLYVDYLLKFLDAYKSNNLDVWGISTGNEPSNAIVPNDPLSTMGWTPQSVAKWVGQYLGPTLAKSAHKRTKILAHDDQRVELPWYVDAMLKNAAARNYTSGIAVHWYFDAFAPASVLDKTHDHFPEKFILMTEACEGAQTNDVILGSWERGQHYILSIIEYLNNWSIGWVDWNLALNKEGGPNWINNTVDSSIIVNPETDEFFKQPMYYAIHHCSRFIEKGSVRVSASNSTCIKSTAVVTPSEEVVVVLYNNCTSAKDVTLKDSQKGKNINVNIPALSMNTLIYAK